MERHLRTRILVSPSLMAPIADEGFPTVSMAFNAGDSSCFGYDHGNLPPFPESLASMDPSPKLKAPKIETMLNEKQRRFHGFTELPDYQSLESPNLSSVTAESSHKRYRSPPLAPPFPKTPSEMNFQLNAGLRPSVVPRSDIARSRRNRISDRTQILQGLMPWEKKMDTGTMLLEAHKYVRFLEAQVTALQSMPVSSSGFNPSPVPCRAGGLDVLSRQQLLQVMVNSAPVQDFLYKKGFCVFSAEQLAMLRQVIQRRPQILLLLDSNSNHSELSSPN
ncbi:transcription factor bHLH117 [Dioscorea cayenensis subsp. rotundata]|uniref:Transcription factor bHLH117 n=1 Tax=Dioscorea cayennensis subsp. rotundata TaxID=55577 RepID=A0AB40BSE2_DIOCR|nr:transcription factor bHLH117 [Dioscorea cayenensis subsp. rotundata]